MGRVPYPNVTFVIPTRNEEKNIERCLRSIKNQNYPKHKIEIIIVDGRSTDKTVEIAGRYGAKIITNKRIHQEPGKTMAGKLATGDMIFYTDADNVLSHKDWLILMTKPYVDDPTIMGFLPQTIPAPDTNGIDSYLGFLGTDPFTWFVYGKASNPRDFGNLYTPIRETPSYKIFQFPIMDHPLLGLAQGFGTNKTFVRDRNASGDDITAGLRIIENGGRIAYVPSAGIYHYHVDGLTNFIKKYSWRVRNNLSRRVPSMGLVHRMKYYSLVRKIRIILFIPYALTLVFPVIHALILSVRFRNPVMVWHIPMTGILAEIIIKETLHFFLLKKTMPLTYYEQ